jgi:putative redox protein
MSSTPLQVLQSDPRTVFVHGNASGFSQEIVVGRHRLAADEPIASSGMDTGPSPYDFLLAALGSCTSMTVSAYARRKQWPLKEVRVRLRHSRNHADDCEDCDTKPAAIDRIEMEIVLAGSLTDEQRVRLLEISNLCPVHRTLTSKVKIESWLG